MTEGSASNCGHKAKSRERGKNNSQLVGETTGRKKLSRNKLSEKHEVQKDMKPPELMHGKLPSRMAIEPPDIESESCIICASDIIHESFGPCNHRTCHICSIRMRVLFKDKTCTLCRTPAPHVVITDSRTKRFEEFTDEYFKNMDFPSIEENIGLRFDNLQIRNDTLWMLAYNCPEKNCDVACLSWPSLHDHTRKVHSKKICDLCSRHRKIFPHEHDLFTDTELSKHMKKGDKNPTSGNQTGFKGHPLCNFCGNRFYGDDELYKHLRERHERCFVCDLANPDKPPSYYINYEALRLHFVQDHFICKVKDCLDQKYIAFVSEFELRAHMIEVHGNSLSKDDRRDMRNIDLSDFSYRQPYLQERRETFSHRGNLANRGRGKGRGRDPNIGIPLPVTSQSLRRDEQAFQRQLAVQSSQSITTRNFGHQLTTSSASASASASNERQKLQTQVAKHVQTSGNPESAIKGASSNSDLVRINNNTQSERVRSLKDRAVNERAALLLQRSPLKISQFHSSLVAFKDSSVTASSFIDNLLLLFVDTPSSSLGTLIREIADLIEDEKKAEELRAAWNNWRAVNEDYPSLPTASNIGDSSSILSWAARTGNSLSSGHNALTSSVRIMKLKKSTAQSGLSPISQSRSWGSASMASGSVEKDSSKVVNNSSSAFPSLPTGNKNLSNSRKPATKMWASTLNVTGNSSSNSQDNSGPSRRPVILSTGSNIESKKGKEAFPSLPSVEKPHGQTFGNGNSPIKRNIGAPKDNVWRGNGETSISGRDVQANSYVIDEEGSSKGKKKGNKEKKKQLLTGWG